MKALTNILTRLLMLMLLMLVACTEETAEVDNLTRQEQYVQVRMQVPGMTAAATRADNEETITSVTALLFGSDSKLLKVVSATDITTDKFNLTVPNGTKNIHFFANLPENYDLSGVQKESDLTTLTTTYYDNLVYWGMATYDGSNSTLSTTLYRNMAKISIKPSEGEDAALNVFKQNDLTIAGLVNANTSGTLVPYNGGFYVSNSATAPEFLTLPNPAPTRQNIEYNSLPNFVYAFEHENDNYEGFVLHVICKIGTYYYKVALIDENSNPYDIIRNHEYIIYVSDVDDYAHDDNYRASSYNDALGKKPINLEVKQIAQVAFSNTNDKTIDWNNGNPNSFNVEMSNITEGTVTLNIAAEGFQVTQGGNELQIVEGNYTYTGGNTTFTFTPTVIGEHTIIITGSGQYATVLETTITVNVQASIKAEANKTQLYYDSNDEQTVMVNVTIPTGVKTLNISAADFIFDEDSDGDYTYTTNSQTSAALLFKLKSSIQEAKTSKITISDAGGNATQTSVSINLVKTPVVTFTPSAETIYLNGGTPNSLNVTMNGNDVPNNATVSLTITALDFTITAQNGTTLSQNGNEWTYNGTLTTLVFTPTSAGVKPISIAGSGENINVVGDSFDVTVKASITAKATPSTIYYDGDDKSVTVSVTIPKGVLGLEINADDFTVKQGETSLTYDETKGVYTYSRGDATTQVDVDFVFTLKDGVTEDSSITFSDAANSEYVDDIEVDINVEATPQQGGEVNWDDIKYPITISNNNACILLKARQGSESGILDTHRNDFIPDATLKVEFTSTTEGYPLSLQTTWGGDYEEIYQTENSKKYLIYTFDSSQFVIENGGENNLANAGLKLLCGSETSVTITKISITQKQNNKTDAARYVPTK